MQDSMENGSPEDGTVEPGDAAKASSGRVRRDSEVAANLKKQRYRALESSIDAVSDSYSGALEIDNLESASLPNKRAIVEALHHLEHAIFMGFYTVKDLHRDNLRHALAEHMHAAHKILVEQMRRAFAYDHWIGRDNAEAPKPEPEEIVLQLLREIPRLRQVLNGDVLAAYDGDPAAKSVEEIIFSYPSVQALTAHRIAHELERYGVPMIPRIISEDAHSRTGIDINPGASIGERCFIDHGTGVVIGETAEIGHGVKLYQGVTLGALSVPGRSQPNVKRHPTLEDDVTIYAGATILGGETVIGRGSIVGGNVWLVRSVPPYSKVFGRPKNRDSMFPMPASRSGDASEPPSQPSE